MYKPAPHGMLIHSAVSFDAGAYRNLNLPALGLDDLNKLYQFCDRPLDYRRDLISTRKVVSRTYWPISLRCPRCRY